MTTGPQIGNDQLSNYMLPRFTGLVSVVKDHRGDEVYPICSGVILILRNHPVLVTVAHYLKDVLKWKKQGRLDQLGLLVHPNAHGTTPVILELQPQYVLISDDYDIGCLILSREEFRKSNDGGGVVLDAALFSEKSDIPEMCILAGHSSALSRTRQEVIATDEDACLAWQMITLTNVTVALVRVAGFESGDVTGTLRYVPVNQNLRTYEGMSGGPVFGFGRGTQKVEIRILAIQSKQITKGEILTSLIGTRGDIAVQEVERMLDELDTSGKGTANGA
jgi:hypothetical protein